MDNKRIFGFGSSYILYALILFFIYLFLPTKQSTIDGYGYANYIRDAESLFLSHHLLYNFIGYLWVSFLKLVGISNTLGALKALNAIFAALSLLTLGKIFKKLGYSDSKTSVWVLFTGSSWGVMRFATENETYIIPIFLSLLASHFYLLHCKQKSSTRILLAGFFAAFACLVHQIHFFWWLAIILALFIKRDYRGALKYAIPALLVPIVYSLVLRLYYNIELSLESLLEFALRDFYSGSATVGFGLKYIVLSGISFFRAFLQVHGYLGNLMEISHWYILGVLGFIVLISIGLYNIKEMSASFKEILSPITLAFLIAFGLHILFAVMSHGNSEFMVMLPFLVAIILSKILSNEILLVGYIALAIFVWNISFGLIPLSRHSIDGNGMVAIAVEKSNSTQTLFVVFSKPSIDNQVRYYNGNYPTNTISATQTKDTGDVVEAIYIALSNGQTVYTDCIDRPKTISRESLTMVSNLQVFSGFHQQKVDSIKTLTGKYYLVKLIPTNSIQIKGEN
jgi:hypothetical protein